MDSQDDLLVMGEDFGGLGNCSRQALEQFSQLFNPFMLVRVNVLTCLVVFSVAIFVAIGIYMPSYRHRSFVRFIFLGATTLFLPVLSYVVSNATTMASTYYDSFFFPRRDSLSYEIMTPGCDAGAHLSLIIHMIVLAEIVLINANTIVVTDDREGRNNGLPVALIARTMWTLYLALTIGGIDFSIGNFLYLLIFTIVFLKVVLKCFAFWLARRSLAHGRNPRLIVGYMMQLSQRSQHVGPTVEQQVEIIDAQLLPPPLILKREGIQKVSKQPHGYCIELMPGQDDIDMMNSLMTIDKVWRLDDKIMRSMPRMKDVCFSFALFKLLRCRIAGYTVIEAGFTQVHNFFWHELMLKDSTARRVFRVIEDELSFLHDYYYTSLPMSYTNSGLQLLSIFSSSIALVYCFLVALQMAEFLLWGYLPGSGQVSCTISCSDSSLRNTESYQGVKDTVNFGSWYLDLVPLFLLLVLAVLAEIRDVGAHIFSNLAKVDNICDEVAKHGTIRSRICRWVITVSELGCCRWMKHRMNKMGQCSVLVTVSELGCCRSMKHRMDKMGQCSVVVLYLKYCRMISRLWIYFRLGDTCKMVKVPVVVKAAIVNTFKRNNGVRSSGEAFLPRKAQGGSNFIWDLSDKGPAHTILICHIATSLLELRRPQPSPASDDEITATHLSRYCAYLVSHVPELLPDDDRWCKSLYKAVKKNSLHLLSCGVTSYEPLVKLLGNPVAHEVLQKGASLATKLVTEYKSTVWSVLTEFWSEMILQVASSSKLENHAEAIAGGTELITLVWALVMHAGPAPEPEAGTVVPPSEIVEVLVHAGPAPAPEAGTEVAPSEIVEVRIDH